MKVNRLIVLALLATLLVSAIGCGTAPSDAQSHLERANEYTDAEEWSKAIAEYTEALELDPNNARAYNNRATAYSRRGQVDQAIADCTKAIELDPNLSMAYYNRAVAYAEQGKKAEAISDLEEYIAVSQDPYVVQLANGLLETLR